MSVGEPYPYDWFGYPSSFSIACPWCGHEHQFGFYVGSLQRWHCCPRCGRMMPTRAFLLHNVARHMMKLPTMPYEGQECDAHYDY